MRLNNETNIGILVVVTLGLLAVLTWRTGNFDFSTESYELKVTFKDVEGVAENSPVTLNGLDVGRVKSIRIDYGEETRVELTLWLHSNARIKQGAIARVKNMGFMGEKYIALTSGDDGKEYLVPGAVIVGEEPTSFDEVMANGEEIAMNLKEISEEINERLKVNSQAIDEVVENIRVSTGHIASISENVDERLELNKLKIDALATSLNGAGKNLEELSLDLKENPWKLLHRPKKRK